MASKGVVVLHDTKRDQERSWGLNANEVRVIDERNCRSTFIY